MPGMGRQEIPAAGGNFSRPSPIQPHPTPERPRLQQDGAGGWTDSRQDVCKFHSRV